MKACQALSAVSIALLLCSGTALAQDAVKADPAHYKVVFENTVVRVLKIDYAPGAKSPVHQHPDAVVVPLNASKVRFGMTDGKSEVAEMTAEMPRFTPAVTHTVTNIGSGPIDGLLIEFKSAAPGKATLPQARAGLAMKVLAEDPRAVVIRSTAEPGFAEPAGSKHEYDQVVIALGAAEMSLSIDGKPAKTKWARGDVQFIGRGVAHEAKNMAGKPVDFIIVSIR